MRGDFGAWHDPLVPMKVDSFSQATDDYQGWRTIGVPLFESAELTDKLLRIFLSLSPKDGWVGDTHPVMRTGNHIDDIGNLYARGLWLPCIERMAMAGQVDERNDRLPDWAAVPRFDRGDLTFFAARRLSKPPRGWGALPGASAHYMASWFSPDEAETRRSDRFEHGRMLVKSYPVSVVRDRICPMKASQLGEFVKLTASFAVDTAVALTTVADFQFLWQVDTEEDVLGFKRRTPLRLGVDADIVKSLFYARQAPLTEAGRRRPILHWVQAHERRLRSGIDIDIRKHLRGITAFEMDGFPFRITQPTKGDSL